MKPSLLKECIKIAIKSKDNLLIYSEPGTGKTQITTQACEEEGMTDVRYLNDSQIEDTPCYILTHPVTDDPTNWKGFPHIYKDENGNLRATFIPFDDLLKMMRVKKRTAVIFDDFGQAPPAVQAPAMQTLHGRKINGYTISPEIVFFILTNRRQDMAGVSGVLEPVKSRVISSIRAETDLNDWSKYAIEKNFSFETIAFNRWKGNALLDFKPTKDMTNSPCPRTWEAVSKILQHGYPSEAELELISGAIGEGMAIEFMAFLKIARSLPDPDLICLRPDEVPIPKDPTLFALCGALTQRAGENNFPNIVKYANRLPSDFSVMLIVDTITKKKELIKTKSFIDWNLKHQNVLV